MKNNNPLKSISVVMVIMCIGKVLSLVANQAYLSYFGADNEQLNIFSWVLQIPNYLFQSFGTALSSVVIPLFAALHENGEKDRANRFGSNIICIASALTVCLILAGVSLSGVMASFTDFQDKGYAAFLLRLLMPVMLFYALTNILQGILMSLKEFTAPAMIHLPSGIVILLYLLLFARELGVTGLLCAVILGLLLQVIILVWPSRRAGFRFRVVFDLKDPSIRTAGRMTIPIILGASAYQFNMFFNNTMMSNVMPEAVSLFNFVQTLILSAALTLLTAITSVMYPTMTGHYARGDMDAFRKSLADTISGTIFILLPITAGMVCLRYPMLNLISLHGKVSPENITTEARFLLMYCPSFVFLGVKEIVDRAFYSMQTTRISAIVGVIIMAINIALEFVLSKYTPLSGYGIPLAYSVALIIGTCFLVCKLRKRLGHIGGNIGKNVLHSTICTAVMSLGVVGISRVLTGVLDGASIVNRAILFGVPVVVGMIIYFAVAVVIHAGPLEVVLSMLKGKGKSR